MGTNQIQRLLVGSSDRTASLGGLLVPGIAIATYLLLAGTYSMTGDSFTSTPSVITLALVCLGFAAAYAYLDDGLVICVLLAMAPVYAWLLFDYSITAPAPAGLRLLMGSLALGAIVRFPVGITGFVLGAGARRLRDRRWGEIQ